MSRFIVVSRVTLLLWLIGLPVSAQADETSLVGQVVCSNCWFEADRNKVAYGTPGDLDCARRCSETGIPPALAVRDDDGSFELLLLSEPPEGSPTWLELTARFVRVSGLAGGTEEKRTLQVASLELLEESPWPDPAKADPREASSLTWTDLSGHTMSLDDLRGRVVVLNFWATWCAPCRKEMPDLVRVQNDHGMLGVQVIGASADAADQAEAVLEFARSKKINFPIVLGANTDQMQSLGLGVVLPATVVLDRDGHVIERFDGVFERAALTAAIERALDGSEKHAHAEGDKHTHIAASSAVEGSLVPS